jgi:hypothetical protein
VNKLHTAASQSTLNVALFWMSGKNEISRIRIVKSESVAVAYDSLEHLYAAIVELAKGNGIQLEPTCAACSHPRKEHTTLQPPYQCYASIKGYCDCECKGFQYVAEVTR